MLFSEKGAVQCLSQIEEYKKCMAGYDSKSEEFSHPCVSFQNTLHLAGDVV